MSLIKKSLISLSFFITFLVLGFYGYHLYKYPSDRDLSKHLDYLRKHYPDEFIMKIGSKLKTPGSRINHFLNFSAKKEQGVIRVGTFGDSYTFGTEVHKEASYPFQLQTLLNSYFPSQKIEVLNFGTSGHGFQEQFFLWERYTELYKIDYFLYGPYGFFPDRDLTFQKNWTYKLMDFYFPRNRFILSEKNKVNLIVLKGSSPEEKYKNYYALFPSFTALRYDRKPFQLWESYFPFLRGILTTTLPLYFYYSDLPEHIESQKINQILLKKIKSVHKKKILFLTIKKSFFKNYQDIKTLFNLNLFNLVFYDKFLYRICGHFSSLGNEIVSRIYFYALMGKTEFEVNTLNCEFNKKSAPVHSTENINLNNVKKIFTGTSSLLLGEVRLNSSDHYWRQEGASFSQNKPENIKSFIGFSDSSTNDIGLSPYFPVPLKLSHKNTIFIRFSNGERVSLGQVKKLDMSGKFFNFYLNYTDVKLDENDRHYEVHFLKEKFPQSLKEKLDLLSNKKTYLLIDDYVLGKLLPGTYHEEPSLIFKPLAKNSFLMMGPQHLVQEKQLPAKFPLYIHYIMQDDRVFKSLIPDWSCYKEKQTYKLELPNFEPLKKIRSPAASHPL